MGTSWSVKCALPPGFSADVASGVQQQLDRVVQQMSTWEPGSDLSRYNSAPSGNWVVLPEQCFYVLRYALTVAEASDGAYDPTAGPLVNLWGFGPEQREPRCPDAAAIAAARRRVGWQRVEVESAMRRVYQPGGIYLDFSAIAKGYGVDQVALYLDTLGLGNYLVEVGGELRGAGVTSDAMPWWVTLEQPPADDRSSHELIENVIALHGLSVATSGDYRRFFFVQSAPECVATRYSHTIDPRSGEPIQHGLASVTVLHPDCIAADVISTALNVLGTVQGLQFATERGVAARFVQRTPTGFDEVVTPAYESFCR
jgi:thiamine biosynthesis lipoprotein